MSYFFYGSPYVKQQGNTEQHALFNFVVGRFVVVHPDQHLLNTVKNLFSSRYQLILCSLHTAKNFHADIIDNSICYNWTMSNAHMMRATRFPEADAVPFACDYLLELDNIDTQEKIWMDREYFWYACTWIYAITNFVNPAWNHDRFIDREMLVYADPGFVSCDQSYNIDSLRQQVFSIIYQTFDFAEAEKKIRSVIEQHERYFDAWKIDIKKINLSIDR